MKKNAGKSDLLSLTQLASRLHINRGTLSRKLSGLDHVPGPKGARLYRLAEVEALLDEERDPEMLEARLRKLRAEASLAELKLGREREELLDARGVGTRIINIFRAWNRRLSVTMPREISQQLHKAETAEHVAEILKAEAGRMLTEFVQDHVGFIRNTEGLDGGLIDERM
jgi:transcriptional regulator with XRE-family HTH domain